jgi:hypothetical protein
MNEQNNNQEKVKRDIWVEAIKTIVGYYKKTLLDFIDILLQSTSDPKTKSLLGRVKGRVHNDLSQCVLNLGILLQTMRSGGNIEPFKDNLIGSKPDDSLRRFRNREKRDGDSDTKGQIQTDQDRQA